MVLVVDLNQINMSTYNLLGNWFNFILNLSIDLTLNFLIKLLFVFFIVFIHSVSIVFFNFFWAFVLFMVVFYLDFLIWLLHHIITIFTFTIFCNVNLFLTYFILFPNFINFFLKMIVSKLVILNLFYFIFL